MCFFVLSRSKQVLDELVEGFSCADFYLLQRKQFQHWGEGW